MKPSEVLAFAKKNNVKMVDLRFIDWPGMWQHVTRPLCELEESSFEDGFGFDGSSIRGWQAINNSDMIAVPDPTTAIMDPFFKDPTMVLICDIKDPITKQSYSRDPRHIARKCTEYMKSTGIADTAFIGPEAEFFVFNDVRYDLTTNSAFYEIDSVEGQWNSGKDEAPNLGHKPRYKGGYFPTPPVDSMQDLRSEMVLRMQEVGMHIEAHHHEVATAGQAEIDIRFDELNKMADTLCWFKYIIKQVARQHNMTATFMPKPLFGDNGSGMHVHVSLWKNSKNLFAGDGYAGFSEMGLYFIGGLLKHAPAILGFACPTVNSYRRMVPGYEAPVNLAYSSRNRSAAIRIPMYSNSPKAKRVEFRPPDPSSNPYLTFAAMVMAGLDGIQNKIDPGEPLDKNIYNLSAEEKKNVPSVPGSLRAALKALEEDHEFLLKGDVFTPDAIETWIDYKIKEEVEPIDLRPHPMEFQMYYDI